MINKGKIDLALNELKNDPAVSHLYDSASNTKEGLLSDVVVTVKDVYTTNDAPTQASSKILEGFNPGYNATIINKLKNEGALIAAKVHLDELALGGTGQHNAFGEIDNLIDKDRIVGGSSSGSASTFTKNIGLAIGSDTGDSVRLPASYNGLVGFKPSYGAISRYGQIAYASSLDTVGYFTHNVSDAIVASNVLFGKDDLDMTSKDVEKPENVIIKPKKIGVIKNSINMSQYLIDKYSNTINKLKDDSIEIVEFELNQKLINNIDAVYQAISYSEVSSNDSNLTGIQFGPGQKGNDWNEIMVNTRTNLLGDLVKRRMTLGAYFLSAENQKDIFVKAQKVRRLIVDEFNNIKNQVDVLIFPATTIAPLKSEAKKDDWLGSYLIQANLSGAPSIVIPWGKHEGMPFGLAIDSFIYNDKKLLSNTLYIEKLLGGDYE